MRRAVEQLEEPLGRFVRDAHPLVEHAHAELSGGLFDDDPHLGPGRAVFGGVAEQVLDDLLDVHLLAEDQPQPGRKLGDEPVVGPVRGLVGDPPPHDVSHQQRVERHLQPARLCPAEHEQVFGEPAQPIRLALDVLDHLAERIRVHGPVALAEHLAHAVDRRDRCPQLVADDAGERLAELLRALSGAIPFRDVDRAGECLGHRCDQPLIRVREPRRRRGLELDQPERFVAADDRGAEPRADRARHGRAATSDIVDAHRAKLADHRPARARPLRDARTAGTAPPVPGRRTDEEGVAFDERYRAAAELDDDPRGDRAPSAARCRDSVRPTRPSRCRARAGRPRASGRPALPRRRPPVGRFRAT